MKKIRSKVLKALALTLAISSLGTIAPNSLLTQAHADGQAYWQQINNNWYYKDSTGKVETGWIQDNGYWYYLDSNGVMKTGWIYDSGNWYYCWSNGQMATNTTINGYYVNSSGAWTTSTSLTSNSSGNDLTWKDINGNHRQRGDIAARVDDVNAANQLTNYNIDLSTDEKIKLDNLCIDLAKQKTTIDEARSNCIGKVVNGKYKISDIKFFDQVFNITTGTSTNAEVKAIKGSSLDDYNSSSTYKFDEFLVYSCGNDKSSLWESMRIVIECEAV